MGATSRLDRHGVSSYELRLETMLAMRRLTPKPTRELIADVARALGEDVHARRFLRALKWLCVGGYAVRSKDGYTLAPRGWPAFEQYMRERAPHLTRAA